MLTLDDAGCRHFDGAVALCRNGAFSVNGFAQRVDNTADQAIANGNGYDTAGAFDDIALFNAVVGT